MELVINFIGHLFVKSNTYAFELDKKFEREKTQRDSVSLLNRHASGMFRSNGRVDLRFSPCLSVEIDWLAAASAGCTRNVGSRSCPIRSSTLRCRCSWERMLLIPM